MQRIVLFIQTKLFLGCGDGGIVDIKIREFVKFEKRNAAFTLLIDTIVGSDGKEPGDERAVWVVTFKVLIRPPKSLLGSVFSCTCFTEHSKTHVVNRILVGFNKLSESFIVPIAGFFDPLAVRVCHYNTVSSIVL